MRGYFAAVPRQIRERFRQGDSRCRYTGSSMYLIRTFAVLALSALSLPAADEAPNMRQNYDRQLSGVEREVVGLVEAMPADKFGFAPSTPGGAFTGVRTFGVQAKHVAFAINQISSGLLGEPIAPAKDDNGPAELTKKEDIVKYVKDAFAHAHKAVGTVTNANLAEAMPSPFNPKNTTTRAESVGMLFWHTFDHYGQMVVYLRMNGIVPPASQPAGR